MTSTTTTSVTDHLLSREDLEQIRKQVDALEPGVAIQTAIGSVIYWAVWLTGKALRLIWRMWAWVFVVGRRGWRQSMGKPDPIPSRTELLRIIDAQHKALERYEQGFVAPGTPVGSG